MRAYPNWQYEEMQYSGVDYTDISQVQAYDEKMQGIRDIKSEAQEVLESLSLNKDDALLEIGAGTGAFAIEASKRCAKVIAVDVSPVMLDYAKQKAASSGAANIEFVNAGFLTYEYHGEPIGAVVSQLALHHLPDFWKMIALIKIAALLKSGGKFFLRDTVYSFDAKDYEQALNTWVEEFTKSTGEKFAADLETAIRQEYATLHWIMEELIIKAGFVIEKKHYQDSYLAAYLCSKR